MGSESQKGALFIQLCSQICHVSSYENIWHGSLIAWSSFEWGRANAKHVHDAGDYPNGRGSIRRRSGEWHLGGTSCCVHNTKRLASYLFGGIHTEMFQGTTIPRTLVLLREHTSRFSLQPSGPTALDGMSLSNALLHLLTMLLALNNILDEFYLKYAEKQTAEEWLDNHDFASAVADDAEILWTSR